MLFRSNTKRRALIWWADGDGRSFAQRALWLVEREIVAWSAETARPRPVSVVKAVLACELVDRRRDVRYSVASLWEVAIKASLKRADVPVSPMDLRQRLLAAGFAELPIQPDHGLAVEHLPWIHRDPFDRLLVAQAALEGLQLLTTDITLTGYGEPVRWVAG